MEIWKLAAAPTRCTSPLIAADAGGGGGNVPVYEVAGLVGTVGALHKAAGQVPERKEGGIVQGEGTSRRLSSAAAEEELSSIDAS